MIKLHYLKHSRAQRILWFLEELCVPYDLVIYHRDKKTKQAPESLKQIHPLGKSPILEDGDTIICESGALVDYLGSTYAEGVFRPPEGGMDFKQYKELMHYAEGSAINPFLLAFHLEKLGEASALIFPYIRSEMANNLSYMASILGDKKFFVGGHLTGADILLSFVLEGAVVLDSLKDFPTLETYLADIQQRPAYQAALDKGGSYNLATLED